MLNYELALKLKEAGFKGQHYPEGLWEQVGDDNGNWVSSPPLEELIEALPNLDAIIQSRTQKGIWVASCGTNDGPRAGMGSTPTEAVANLWLVLNSKKDI